MSNVIRNPKSAIRNSSGVMGREAPDIETSSASYASRFAGPVGAWFLTLQEELTARMASRYPGATIVDVGGGHGQLAGPLARRGYSVTVVGSDPACRARLERARCEFVVGDVLDLPFEAQAFDVAVSIRLLPHLARWDRLIAELARVARRAVIVDYPTVRSLNGLSPALFSAKRRLEGNTRPYTSFHEPHVVARFEEQGFRLRERAAEFFWPMVMHRVLKRPQVSAGLEQVARTTRLTDWFGSPVLSVFERQGGGA